MSFQKISYILLLIITFSFGATPALAQVDVLQNVLSETADNAGLATDEESTNLQARIGLLINALFGIIGVIFLIVVVIGGVLWIMAGGNEEKVGKAKKYIIGGIEGIGIFCWVWVIIF